MSTKIYNGYRIAGVDGQRPSAFAVITDLHPRLLEVKRRAAARALVELAVKNATGTKLSEDEQPGGSPIGNAWLTLRDVVKKLAASPYRNGGMDLTFSVTFLADPAAPGGLYAMTHTERSDYIEAWEATSGVQPWPYWNNCDRPDDVTDDEWDQRRGTWDRVIGWDPPCRRGLVWDPFTDADRIPMPREIKDIAAGFITDPNVTVDMLYARAATS